jgi:hypothetical protein
MHCVVAIEIKLLCSALATNVSSTSLSTGYSYVELKYTVTKFKAIDKVLENIDSKVTEVGSSNHQVLNMMKMLETQVGQLAGRLTTNEGKLPRQPKGPKSAKAIQTRSGNETEDPEHSAGARKPKPSVEAEEFAKEEVTRIVPEEPDFEMAGEDMKIPQLKPRYF